MASLYKKVISGKPYWYLREMAWVDGKPKLVSERYLGSAADIAALLAARETAIMPERTRHLAFGDVAAAWGIITRLGVVDTIDEVVGSRRSDAGASVGTYLALAALNRLVDPAPNGRSSTGGRPPPPTGSPRSARRCWTTASSGRRCAPLPCRSWPKSSRPWPCA